MNSFLFIEKAKNKFGDKYDYSKVIYKNNKTKIVVICPNHGEFLQTPTNHIHGNGCPICSRKGQIYLCKSSTNLFIKKAKLKHGDKYDYSKVDYISSINPVIIICSKHGEFIQTPGSHLQGSNCQKCSNEIVNNLCRSSNTHFVEKSNIIHKGKYDYSKIQYINAYTNITIICSIHGEFSQLPTNHLKGSGCPKCKYKIYNLSYEWLNMIKVNIPHLRTFESLGGEYRIPDTNYYADGYDENTKTIYEFHGNYWHGNPKIYNQNDINPTTKCTFGELYKNTQIKRKICESIGYKYVEIWEREWKILKRVIKRKQKQIKQKLA